MNLEDRIRRSADGPSAAPVTRTPDRVLADVNTRIRRRGRRRVATSTAIMASTVALVAVAVWPDRPSEDEVVALDTIDRPIIESGADPPTVFVALVDYPDHAGNYELATFALDGSAPRPRRRAGRRSSSRRATAGDRRVHRRTDRRSAGQRDMHEPGPTDDHRSP